jgi:hypothetical protein
VNRFDSVCWGTTSLQWILALDELKFESGRDGSGPDFCLKLVIEVRPLIKNRHQVCKQFLFQNKRDRLLFPELHLFDVLQFDPARSGVYLSVKLGLVAWI